MARAKRKTRSTAGRGARTKVAARTGTARVAKKAGAKKAGVKKAGVKKVGVKKAGVKKVSVKKVGAKKTARAASDRQNRWTAQEDRQLRTMVRQGYPIRDVVEALGRTESAVRQHVYKLGLTLRGRKRR